MEWIQDGYSMEAEMEVEAEVVCMSALGPLQLATTSLGPGTADR